jgi:hypothetical protein
LPVVPRFFSHRLLLIEFFIEMFWRFKLWAFNWRVSQWPRFVYCCVLYLSNRPSVNYGFVGVHSKCVGWVWASKERTFNRH